MPSFQGQNPEALLTRVPQQEMYANMLNVVQGTFLSEYQVTETRQIAAADLANALAGRCAYIDPTSGNFKPGLVAGCIPFLLRPVGGYAGVPAVGNVYGDGVLAIPVTVGQKVQTTEFIAETFVANQPLTAINTTGDNKGKICKGSYYNDTILGIVTEPIASIVPGKSMLTFLTYFLPPLDIGSVVN